MAFAVEKLLNITELHKKIFISKVVLTISLVVDQCILKLALDHGLTLYNFEPNEFCNALDEMSHSVKTEHYNTILAHIKEFVENDELNALDSSPNKNSRAIYKNALGISNCIKDMISVTPNVDHVMSVFIQNVDGIERCYDRIKDSWDEDKKGSIPGLYFEESLMNTLLDVM